MTAVKCEASEGEDMRPDRMSRLIRITNHGRMLVDAGRLLAVVLLWLLQLVN